MGLGVSKWVSRASLSVKRPGDLLGRVFVPLQTITIWMRPPVAATERRAAIWHEAAAVQRKHPRYEVVGRNGVSHWVFLA
jgi:hypothetical protein